MTTDILERWCSSCNAAVMMMADLQCPRCGSLLEDQPMELPADSQVKQESQLVQFLAMLRAAGIRYIGVGDLDKLETYKVSVENLVIEDDLRVDVEFEFSMPTGSLSSVRARRG